MKNLDDEFVLALAIERELPICGQPQNHDKEIRRWPHRSP
jgi:hypothetical protein